MAGDAAGDVTGMPQVFLIEILKIALSRKSTIGRRVLRAGEIFSSLLVFFCLNTGSDMYSRKILLYDSPIIK